MLKYNYTTNPEGDKMSKTEMTKEARIESARDAAAMLRQAHLAYANALEALDADKEDEAAQHLYVAQQYQLLGKGLLNKAILGYEEAFSA